MFQKNSQKLNTAIFLFVCLLHVALVMTLVRQRAKVENKQQAITISLFTIPKSQNSIEKSTPSPTPPIKKPTPKKQIIKKIETKAFKKEITTPPPVEPIQPQTPNESINANNPTNTAKRLYIAPTTENNPPIPQALFNPKPPYPGEAFDKGQEGTVILDVKIAKSGKVLEVKVYESSQHSLLDQSALETVKLWIFNSNSIPKEEWVRIPINFKIVNK